MKKTTEEKHALKKAQSTPLTLEGQECAFPSHATYDGVRQLLWDDSEMTHEEMRQLRARSYNGSGWEESATDLYDNYNEELRKRCR